MRVGVNTGAVVVGDARAGGSRATGDAVTVAARLQQSAEPGETLVGDSTWRLVRDAVVTGEPRRVQVKGREEPVTVRRLVAVDQVADAIHRRVGGPMVGRDRELGILRAAFERAVVEERCVLVTVLGSAGVGKSRLVHEFLTGRGRRHGPPRPLPAVRPGDHLVSRGGTPPLGGRARRGGRPVHRHGPAARPPRRRRGRRGDPCAARRATRDRLRAGARSRNSSGPIRRFLERLATDGPVVVVLDDLQWAEPALLDLVEHLADWVHGVPLLLLAMARPELLDVRVGWGGGKPDATTFLLEPLPTADTEHLVEALLGERPSRRRRASGSPRPPTATRCTSNRSSRCSLDDGVVQRGPDGVARHRRPRDDLRPAHHPGTPRRAPRPPERRRAADDRAGRRGRQGVRPARRLGADAGRGSRRRVRAS